MMSFYRELRLFPSAEIPLSFLWSKIFFQIHLALAEQKEKNGTGLYGLSFPEYNEKGLGSKLRVFAETREQLEALPLEKYLQRYMDYVRITGIRHVSPRAHKYASYSRYQPDANVEGKARRYVKRHEGTTYEEALALLGRRKETYQLPFIQLRSLSSEQSYNLFIRKEEKSEPTTGAFSSYGLSAAATVPEF